MLELCCRAIKIILPQSIYPRWLARFAPVSRSPPNSATEANRLRGRRRLNHLRRRRTHRYPNDRNLFQAETARDNRRSPPERSTLSTPKIWHPSPGRVPAQPAAPAPQKFTGFSERRLLDFPPRRPRCPAPVAPPGVGDDVRLPGEGYDVRDCVEKGLAAPPQPPGSAWPSKKGLRWLGRLGPRGR